MRPLTVRDGASHLLTMRNTKHPGLILRSRALRGVSKDGPETSFNSP
jgi:hypothetical protein